MGWSTKEKYLLGALILLVILVAAYAVYHTKWMKKHCVCTSAHDGFSSDLEGWPTAGSFGNLGDTNPYGNYADSQAMYWPTMNMNKTWTRI